MLIQFSDNLPDNGSLYFTIQWTTPCRLLNPILEVLPHPIIEIDIDQYIEVAKTLNIVHVPTLMRLKGGKPAERITGAITAVRAQELVENVQ